MLMKKDYSCEVIRDLDLSGKKLMGYDFSKAYLVGCSFRRSLLIGCNFSGAVFINCCFDIACIKGTDMSTAVFTNKTTKKEDCVRAKFLNCTFRKSLLANVNFYYSFARNIDLSGAVMDRCRLDYAEWEEINLTSASMFNITVDSGCMLGSDFIDCKLKNVGFRLTDLEGSIFGSINTFGNNGIFDGCLNFADISDADRISFRREEYEKFSSENKRIRYDMESIDEIYRQLKIAEKKKKAEEEAKSKRKSQKKRRVCRKVSSAA